MAFAGRQIARIEPNDPSYHSALSRSEWITLIFEVERVFKGQAGPLLAARTAYGGGDCGVDYGDMGTVGIVAQRWEEGGWRVGQPGDLLVSVWVSRYAIRRVGGGVRSRLPAGRNDGRGSRTVGKPDDRSPSDAAVAEESEVAFGPGYPPEENTDSRNGASAVTAVLPIGGAAVALAGGAALMRNRRRRSTRKGAQ